MDVRELGISGAWEFTPMVHADDRGTFVEWYRFEHLEHLTGQAPLWRQANTSVSSGGVLRGIHFSVGLPGQAKYVTVTRGRIIDFVVDVRVGSPSFGSWEAVELDASSRRSLYLSAGLGHAFLALEDDSTVSYLCSEVYNPGVELAVDPLDGEIGLTLPDLGHPIRVSDRDAAAPTLSEALSAGTLPRWTGGAR